MSYQDRMANLFQAKNPYLLEFTWDQIPKEVSVILQPTTTSMSKINL